MNWRPPIATIEEDAGGASATRLTILGVAYAWRDKEIYTPVVPG